MRRAIYILMLFQMPFLLGANTPDEEYAACRAKCAAEDAACRAEVPAAESKAKTAIETTCEMEVNACREECDERRSLPGLVRKLME